MQILGGGGGWGRVEGLYLAKGWSMSNVGQECLFHAGGAACAKAMGQKGIWYVCRTALFQNYIDFCN